jgi:ribosomal-protein-alanine N-acetyltransferase
MDRRPFAVRPARPDDYEAFSELFLELEVEDPVPDRKDWESSLASSTVVATSGEEVIGYCYFQEHAHTGYVRNIAVAAEARRRGVGRAIMDSVAGRLRTGGKTSWVLNVRPDNQAAIALYEGMGLRVRYRATAHRLTWASLDRLPDGSATAQPLSGDDEAAAEERFGLPPGQLAFARNSGRALLKANSGAHGEVVGLAVFSPDLARAFPFRVAGFEAVKPLLIEMRSQLPGGEHVTLVAEDDRALTNLLISAGAGVRDELLHMEGLL